MVSQQRPVPVEEEDLDNMKIFGLSVPIIAAGLALGALTVGGLALVNQWRNEQQRIADEQTKRQQLRYQQYYNDYYADAYRKQNEQYTAASRQRPTPQQSQPDFDRIWVSDNKPNSQTNVIKPEYMYSTGPGAEPLADEYDPDMIRANQMMHGGAAGAPPGNAQPSVSSPESDYYIPEETGDYDPSAPENLEYNENTGELRPRERKPANQSRFGANVSSGIG